MRLPSQVCRKSSHSFDVLKFHLNFFEQYFGKAYVFTCIITEGYGSLSAQYLDLRYFLFLRYKCASVSVLQLFSFFIDIVFFVHRLAYLKSFIEGSAYSTICHAALLISNSLPEYFINVGDRICMVFENSLGFSGLFFQPGMRCDCCQIPCLEMTEMF